MKPAAAQTYHLAHQASWLRLSFVKPQTIAPSYSPRMNTSFDADLLIIGAGPAGLSLAAALAGARLRIAVIERASLASLAAPAFDGREIALTHASMRRLHECGVWARINTSEIAPMKQARVLDGKAALTLMSPRQGEGLGWMVSNQAIRRALFDVTGTQENCSLLTNLTAASVNTNTKGVEVMLDDGRALRTKLVVAADTRFSALRRAAGIGAQMTDFGRTMLVCRVAHSEPHHNVATECFGNVQAIAMLPLNGQLSSYVLTLPTPEIEPLLTMHDDEFTADARARTEGRWGELKLASSRHAYPLVAVYADSFVSRRFALIGDAAVGMHPMTAHGFNFGLAGAHRLAALLRDASERGADIGAQPLLQRYASAHRLATWPLFTLTNAIAKLSADRRPVARFVRGSGLRLMQTATPLRRAVEANLAP